MSEKSQLVELVELVESGEPIVINERVVMLPPEGAAATPDVDVVEVRRNVRLATVVALASLLAALAFLMRGGVEGYLVGLVLLAVAVVQGWTVWDSRLPLLLVDEQGVRLRFGQVWQGIPWSKVDSVEHTPRPEGVERFWKDGRIGVLLHDEEAMLEELSPSARRQALLTQRLYGLPFSIPLGLSTRVIGAGGDLTEAIAAVAADGVEVVEIDTSLAAEEPAADDVPAGEESVAVAAVAAGAAGDDDTAIRPPLSGSAGDTNPRMLRVLDEPDINAADVADESKRDQVDRDTEHETPLSGAGSAADAGPAAGADAEAAAEEMAETKPRLEPVAPLREPSTAIRVDVRFTPEEPTPAIAVHGANALELDPVEVDAVEIDPVKIDPVQIDLVEIGSAQNAVPTADVEDDAAAEETQVVAAISADDTEVREVRSVTETDDRGEVIRFDAFGTGSTGPIAETVPEIGPEIASARRRLDLDVEGLAEWTRIRPHVIEAIEVDDFGPCGGDFYARGHLRTLARVLGIEVTPLLRTYDEKYATGPVSPRAVFEAELAHNAAARPVRRMRGGPSWSVLVAAVMAVILVWSVARLVIDGTQHEPEAGAIQLDGSAGTDNPYGDSAPVAVTVSAAGGSADVVVRDSRGKVVFSGKLAFGESKKLQVVPPLRIQTSDGSLKVAVAEGRAEELGKTGEPAQRTYTVD